MHAAVVVILKGEGRKKIYQLCGFCYQKKKKEKRGEMKGRCESQAAFGAAVSLETREIRGGRCAGLGAGCSPSTAQLKPFVTHVSQAVSLLTWWGGICVPPLSLP